MTDDEAELAAANAREALRQARVTLEENAHPRHLREWEHQEIVHHGWWRAFESARDLAALSHRRGASIFELYDAMNDAVFHGSELFARCGFDPSTDSDTLIEVATLMGSFGDESTAQYLLGCAEDFLARGHSPEVEAAAWLLRLALGRAVATGALAETIARLGSECDVVRSRTIAVLGGAIALIEGDVPALRGSIAGLLASHEGTATRSKSPATLIETSALWLWLMGRRAQLPLPVASPYWPIQAVKFTLGAARADEPASTDLCALLDYYLALPDEDFDADTMAERARRVGFDYWSHSEVVARANELEQRAARRFARRVVAAVDLDEDAEARAAFQVIEAWEGRVAFEAVVPIFFERTARGDALARRLVGWLAAPPVASRDLSREVRRCIDFLCADRYALLDGEQRDEGIRAASRCFEPTSDGGDPELFVERRHDLIATFSRTLDERDHDGASRWVRLFEAIFERLDVADPAYAFAKPHAAAFTTGEFAQSLVREMARAMAVDDDFVAGAAYDLLAKLLAAGTEARAIMAAMLRCARVDAALLLHVAEHGNADARRAALDLAASTFAGGDEASRDALLCHAMATLAATDSDSEGALRWLRAAVDAGLKADAIRTARGGIALVSAFVAETLDAMGLVRTKLRRNVAAGLLCADELDTLDDEELARTASVLMANGALDEGAGVDACLGVSRAAAARWGRSARVPMAIAAALWVPAANAVGWYNLACNLATLGDVERAIEALRRSIAMAPSFAADATTDADFASICEEPRFVALTRGAEARRT